MKLPRSLRDHLLVLALPGLVACIVQPDRPPPASPAAPAQPAEDPAAAAGGTMPAGGCDITSRAFVQTSPGPCASSTWQFTARGDDTYDAKETGCANATGTATYDGTTLLLDFRYADGAGRYTWPLDGQCQGAAGTVSWSAGSLAGQSVASTLALAP